MTRYREPASRRPWSGDEVLFAIRQAAAGVHPADIGARIGRSLQSVQGALYRYGRAPHQVELAFQAGKIAVGCACWPGTIDSRTRFPAAEALTAWRSWHEREGIPLQDNRR